MSDADNSSIKNQQFSRLNTFRRERALVDVYLVSGVRLRGRIRSFDQYSMMLDTGHGDAFLYHHGVSSVGPVAGRGGSGKPRPPRYAETPPPPPAESEDDAAAPPRRPAAAPTKPADVPVVRRVSRKIKLPDDLDRS